MPLWAKIPLAKCDVLGLVDFLERRCAPWDLISVGEMRMRLSGGSRAGEPSESVLALSDIISEAPRLRFTVWFEESDGYMSAP